MLLPAVIVPLAIGFAVRKFRIRLTGALARGATRLLSWFERADRRGGDRIRGAPLWVRLPTRTLIATGIMVCVGIIDRRRGHRASADTRP